MARIIRAKLSGPDARLGDVAAADVARLIIGLERALSRGAYVALGTTRGGQVGRHRTAIERATRLRFVGIEPGSVVELLALPDVSTPTEDELPLAVDDLSAAALTELIRAVASEDVDTELAAAVARLGDDLGIGERNDTLSLSDVGSGPQSAPERTAVVDGEVRQRMRAISRRPPRLQADALVGVLVEADFERQTARLQPPLGGAVTVTFTEDMADDLYRALRHPALLEGHVLYDAKTAAAKEIDLRSISRAEQLALEGRAFFENLTVDDLAREQGVPGPVDEPSQLSDPDLTPEERSAFLAALTDG